MKKILFLIDSLRGGGAEKVLVNLLNHINTDEFDVTVETMFFNGINAANLSPKIKLFCRNAPYFKGVSHVMKYIPEKLLYRYFIGKKKYDVIVAYMHGAPAKVVSGCTDSDVRKYAWIHTKIGKGSTVFKFHRNKSDSVKSYAKFDKIVAVSEDVRERFDEETGLGYKTVVIYNTNDVDKIKSLSCEDFLFDSNRFHICTLGRLSSEKGYDRLVRTAKRLKESGPDFDIHILGDGPERETLSSLIEANNLKNTVYLDGYTENPYRVLSRSDLFVCSSLIEGLSTALSEAVILGVPCVSTDVSGAKEVLGYNNEYGIVTENNEDDLYKALYSMITDKKLYEKYSDSVKLRKSFFDTRKTVGDVEELLRQS